jgi:hypothetical protein
MFIPGSDLWCGARYYSQPSRRPAKPLSWFQSKFQRKLSAEAVRHRLATHGMGDRHLPLLRLAWVRRRSQAPHGGVIHIPKLLHIILISERSEGIGQNSVPVGHD